MQNDKGFSTGPHSEYRVTEYPSKNSAQFLYYRIHILTFGPYTVSRKGDRQGFVIKGRKEKGEIHQLLYAAHTNQEKVAEQRFKNSISEKFTIANLENMSRPRSSISCQR